MIKAVLFDLDGTLLDRDESLKIFVECQYERLDKWMNHIQKDVYISRFIELDNRGYTWKDKVYQQLINEFHIADITWETLLEDYTNQFKHHCRPFSNLVPMLEKLRDKNIRLGMITNGFGQFQMDNIVALGIKDYFDVICISEWEGLRKPDPLIFQKALEQLGVLPTDSIFVGDHPENDINAARNIGMKTIWKKDDQWNDVKADFVIADLDEVVTIVEQLCLQYK